MSSLLEISFSYLIVVHLKETGKPGGDTVFYSRECQKCFGFNSSAKTKRLSPMLP